MINRCQFCFNSAFKFNLRRYTMCGHAINTLSTLACADVAGAESCAAAATAALPCSTPCTTSLNTLRSACDALVPRSQHGRFIEVRRCRLTLSNQR